MNEFFIKDFVLNSVIHKKLTNAELLVTTGFADYVVYLVNSAFAFDFVTVQVLHVGQFLF